MGREIPATENVNTQEALRNLGFDEVQIKKDRKILAFVLWGMIGLWALQEIFK